MDTTQIIITSLNTITQVDSLLINSRLSNILHDNSTIYLIGELNNSSSFFKDNLLSIISILIAGLAFFISWRVLSVTRKHNKLTLKPHLIFRVNTIHKLGTARLYMSNKGLVINRYQYYHYM